MKDLSLDFTVMDNEFGQMTVYELEVGGKDITVTNENRLRYIYAIADFRFHLHFFFFIYDFHSFDCFFIMLFFFGVMLLIGPIFF